MTQTRLKILILGGYGTFGGRLAQLLAQNERLTLIIAGRSLAKAERFIATMPPGAQRKPLAVERAAVGPALAAEKPDLVVDATGPFQAYGGDPYGVVQAAIAAGVHYMDLADGSDFVLGIAQFDAAARDRGVVVLSGVSSFPVLTAAVVRALGQDLTRIDTIIGGIAPSPYAGVGLNVIRAITLYAGQPIRLWRDGKPATGHALTETLRYTVAPPGKLPLHNTRFSLVDVPDLLLIPPEVPGLHAIWMGAGPVPELWHRLLNALAWLVRLKIVPSLAALAPLCSFAINRFRWGEHRGGMFVSVTGRDSQGTEQHRSWHLLAEGGDGPMIPSMAVEALVRKMLDGEMPETGARGATRALELADYDRVFTGRTITTGIRNDTAEAQGPLYRRLLGQAWDQLPGPIRQMHDLSAPFTASGRASIATGRNPLGWLVRRVVGFPEAGADMPVTVSFIQRQGIETWRRDFGGTRFFSTQQAGRGRDARLLIERFGPMTASMAVLATPDRLDLAMRGWQVFGIRLPLWLAPRITANETVEEGRFRFWVEISHPLFGLLVRYVGRLDIDRPG